jgi:hypothetical protein
MTLGQQRRTIAVSSMVVFGLGFLNAAHKHQSPSTRFLIGVGFTYTFISVFADMGAGDFGAGLAILIMISAILFEGEDIVGLFNERAKGKVKIPKGKKGQNTHGGSISQAESIEGIEGEFEQPTGLAKPARLMRSGRLSRR